MRAGGELIDLGSLSREDKAKRAHNGSNLFYVAIFYKAFISSFGLIYGMLTSYSRFRLADLVSVHVQQPAWVIREIPSDGNRGSVCRSPSFSLSLGFSLCL